MKKRKIILATLLMAVMVVGLNGAAHALPCSVGYVNGGGANYDCEDGIVGDNSDWNGDINDGAFFGFTDWVKLEKKETPGDVEVEGFNVGLVLNPDANVDMGTWLFTNSPWSAYSEIMIILKDGRIDMPPIGSHDGDIWYSAYHVTYGDMSGNWDTGGPGLSHMSVYARGGVSLPEPGTMMLLGSGLFGFGVFRKKFIA